MLAGRPHEAVGNGSPRWMTAAPRKRAHRTRPTGRLTPSYAGDLGAEWSPRFLVPSLFRQRHREDRIDSPAAEVFRIGEEVPVGIHRLGDGGMAEPGLNHLGIQVGGDQRRGVEVPKVVGTSLPSGGSEGYSGDRDVM